MQITGTLLIDIDTITEILSKWLLTLNFSKENLLDIYFLFPYFIVPLSIVLLIVFIVLLNQNLLSFHPRWGQDPFKYVLITVFGWSLSLVYLIWTTSLIVISILDDQAQGLYFKGFWHSVGLTMFFVLLLKLIGGIFLSYNKKKPQIIANLI
jgi:hypothetical protein